MGLTATKKRNLEAWFQQTGGLNVSTASERKYVTTKLRNNIHFPSEFKAGDQVIIVERKGFPCTSRLSNITYLKGQTITISKKNHIGYMNSGPPNYSLCIGFDDGNYTNYIEIKHLRKPAIITPHPPKEDTMRRFYMLHLENGESPTTKFETYEAAFNETERILRSQKSGMKIYILIASSMIEIENNPIKTTYLTV